MIRAEREFASTEPAIGLEADPAGRRPLQRCRAELCALTSGDGQWCDGLILKDRFHMFGCRERADCLNWRLHSNRAERVWMFSKSMAAKVPKDAVDFVERVFGGLASDVDSGLTFVARTRSIQPARCGCRCKHDDEMHAILGL